MFKSITGVRIGSERLRQAEHEHNAAMVLLNVDRIGLQRLQSGAELMTRRIQHNMLKLRSDDRVHSATLSATFPTCQVANL